MILDRDAFGRLLMARLEGRAPESFIERSDGYIDSFHVSEYFNPEQDADVVRAMRLARGRILDIGCGAGRHALALQHRGLRVTGLDSSPLAIRVCRKRGVRDARVLGIDQIGQFPAGRFDTVIMFGNNFGLFGSPARARRLLRAIRRITSPRALILAQSLDVHGTRNPTHLGYQRWNRRHGRLPGQVRLRVRFSNRVGPWFDYLMVSPTEMRSILRGTDWKLARCLGGPGALYVAVLEKR